RPSFLRTQESSLLLQAVTTEPGQSCPVPLFGHACLARTCRPSFLRPPGSSLVRHTVRPPTVIPAPAGLQSYATQCPPADRHSCERRNPVLC
ncbi:MAG: hypothetical protein OXR07_07165, partial [Nitrospira sp.]|nr:hypothetical protein [Nitrospira sp.]